MSSNIILKKSQIKKILTEVCEGGINFVHPQGYEWFVNTLLPALHEAEKLLPKELDLLAASWYTVGDVYDFNHAFLKAIEAYKKSLFYVPQQTEANREMASMLENIGQYDEALHFINQALLISPTDKMCLSDKESIENSIAYQKEPFYTEGNREWEMNELLAVGAFYQVIAILENTTDIKELQILARAYAGLNQIDEYFSIWERIIETKQLIDIEKADWFFIPDVVYEKNVDFWYLMKKTIPYHKEYIYFPQLESLYEHYPSLSIAERRNIICDYTIFSLENRQEEIKALQEKYPLCEELREN